MRRRQLVSTITVAAIAAGAVTTVFYYEADRPNPVRTVAPAAAAPAPINTTTNGAQFIGTFNIPQLGIKTAIYPVSISGSTLPVLRTVGAWTLGGTLYGTKGTLLLISDWSQMVNTKVGYTIMAGNTVWIAESVNEYREIPNRYLDASGQRRLVLTVVRPGKPLTIIVAKPQEPQNDGL